MHHPPDTLHARKRRKARAMIVSAAFQLFAEHGFENVTVAAIAERAEVGRTTFFRYFGDKQEIAFAGRSPEEIMREISEQVPIDQPIGDSLRVALGAVRRLVGAYVQQLAESPERYRLHEQLVECNQELRARGVLKQRVYADGLTDHLIRHQATPRIARLAAELGMACFYAGRAEIDGEPERLPAAVDAAFERLGEQARSASDQQ